MFWGVLCERLAVMQPHNSPSLRSLAAINARRKADSTELQIKPHALSKIKRISRLHLATHSSALNVPFMKKWKKVVKKLL